MYHLHLHWKFKLWAGKFALFPQVNFPAHNLNFHWRWWDQVQAIFLNLFSFTYTGTSRSDNPARIQKIFCSFFGSNENKKICIWNLLTLNTYNTVSFYSIMGASFPGFYLFKMSFTEHISTLLLHEGVLFHVFFQTFLRNCTLILKDFDNKFLTYHRIPVPFSSLKK